jgi:hypothetical protein
MKNIKLIKPSIIKLEINMGFLFGSVIIKIENQFLD